MSRRPLFVAGIVAAIALIHAQPVSAQFYSFGKPFGQSSSNAQSDDLVIRPLPPIDSEQGDDTSDQDDSEPNGVQLAAFNSQPQPYRATNQSASGNSVDVTNNAQPPTSGRRSTRPPYRSNNQSGSANSVDANNNLAPMTANPPDQEPTLGGNQTNNNQSGSAYSASEDQHEQPLSGAGSAASAHSSTDELGTIRLPKDEVRPYKPNMPAKKRKVEAEFGDGLTAKSTDGYFTLTFHNLTQVDYRNFQPTGNILTDNFLIPRQRWYVLGNVSPYVRYYTVINRGYNSIDLLDAFIDLNLGVFEKEKFQIRMGRMKTPYTYEYIKISENDLIAPERSVFVGNLAGNRQIGAMAHGQLADKRFEYAVGLFNGPRRSFIDSNNQKDLYTFINTKPFLKSNSEFLQQLNVGGSFNFGYEYNVVAPASFRTASDQSTGTAANQVSPTFLQFNNNIFEQGLRMQWAGDVAYYYKSLGLLVGYQGGFQNYGVASAAIPSTFPAGVTSERTVKVPMNGFSVAAFYFITGEQITRRVELLEPRSEFKGLRGTGTGGIELFSRVANLQLGDSIFSGGLANGALYTNRINTFDNGFNWYVTHYTKLTFDWQYSQYGNPVALSPTKFTKHQNIFWLRAQVFF